MHLQEVLLGENWSLASEDYMHDTEILCNVVNLFLLCPFSCIKLVFVVSPQPDDVVNVAVDKVNGLLESFMGINDTELGKTPTH